MSNLGGQGDYYYGGSPNPDRPRSWVWPALLGAGVVAVALLVLIVALQITGDDDDSADSTDTTSTPAASSVLPTTTSAGTTSASTSASTAGSSPAIPAPPSDQGDGDDGPVDRSCSSYTTDETLPVQLCARGALVEDIQSALTANGFTVEVDGLFGPATEIAVLEFQTREGLAQDGIVGPSTFEVLLPQLTEPD